MTCWQSFRVHSIIQRGLLDIKSKDHACSTWWLTLCKSLKEIHRFCIGPPTLQITIETYTCLFIHTTTTTYTQTFCNIQNNVGMSIELEWCSLLRICIADGSRPQVRHQLQVWNRKWSYEACHWRLKLMAKSTPKQQVPMFKLLAYYNPFFLQLSAWDWTLKSWNLCVMYKHFPYMDGSDSTVPSHWKLITSFTL